MNKYNPFNFLIINELVEAYCEFCELEYEEEYTESQKQELRNEDILPIAYTDIEELLNDDTNENMIDTPLELQCVYCVSKEKYIYTLNGAVILEQKNSVENTIYELENAHFEDFIRDGLYAVNSLFEER